MPSFSFGKETTPISGVVGPEMLSLAGRGDLAT